MPGRRTVYVDVAVVCCQPGPPLAAARAEEGTKCRECPVRDASNRRILDADFSPMVFEVHGAVGPQSDAQLAEWATIAAAARGVPVSQEVERWRAVLGLAVQRGNAAFLLEDNSPLPL
jgi:hypothetical protein